ncbi:aldehyde dehydrogenase family protein [Pseudomonas parakoreensis]
MAAPGRCLEVSRSSRDQRPALRRAIGQTFAAINPATGQLLANVAACGGADVDAAVRNARHVFEAGIWAQRPPAERKQVLLRLAELLMEHRQELALLDSLNMGKPVMDAYNIDVPGAAGVFRWYAESIDKLYDQIAPAPSMCWRPLPVKHWVWWQRWCRGISRWTWPRGSLRQRWRRVTQ